MRQNLSETNLGCTPKKLISKLSWQRARGGGGGGRPTFPNTHSHGKKKAGHYPSVLLSFILANLIGQTKVKEDPGELRVGVMSIYEKVCREAAGNGQGGRVRTRDQI